MCELGYYTGENQISCFSLQLARVDNGGPLAVLDGAALRTGGLKGLDDLERLRVSDLTEDDVSRVEPRGNDGGDEELRAVAGEVG